MADVKTTKKAASSETIATVKKATVKKAAAPKTVKKAPVAETLNTTPAAKVLKEKTSAVRNTVSVEVLDVTGQVVEKITLPGSMFQARVNPTLMAQAVRVYLANQRKGTVSTKTRGEVDGSTRKIYRQKGTGRARHGGIRAPIFVGGGLVFGPKPRDYSLKLPQKMRRAALFSALSVRLSNKEMIVLSGLEAVEPKTKSMHAALKGYLTGTNPSVLLVVPTEGAASLVVRRTVRNIEGVTYLPVNQLNTYEVLKAKKVIMMKDAATAIETVFGKGNA